MEYYDRETLTNKTLPDDLPQVRIELRHADDTPDTSFDFGEAITVLVSVRNPDDTVADRFSGEFVVDVIGPTHRFPIRMTLNRGAGSKTITPPLPGYFQIHPSASDRFIIPSTRIAIAL